MDKPLSNPQRLLLSELVRSGPQFCSQSYKPAQKLVDRGFARWIDDGLNLACTVAGRSFYEGSSE